MAISIPDLVTDFGASHTNTPAQNDTAIRNAIAQTDIVYVPPQPYPGLCISDTMVVEKRTGFTMLGARGSVAAGTMSGSRFWWKGAADGLMLLVNQVNSAEFANLGFYSGAIVNNAYATTAVIHTNDYPITITGSDNIFRNCNFARLKIGIQNGRPGQNLPTTSELVLENPRFTSCGDGLLLQGDQGGNHRIYNLGALSCGNVIRTGDANTYDRGHFTVWGGAVGNCDVVFNLPSVSYSASIHRVTSEREGIFLNVDPVAPASYYTILLDDQCKSSPRAGGKSIVFRQDYDLIARDCWFSGPVEIGNKFNTSTGEAPLRLFEHCWMARPTPIDTNKPWKYVFRDITPWYNQPGFRVAYEMGDQSGPKTIIDWDGNMSGKSWTVLP